jgi:hypothetical protein
MLRLLCFVLTLLLAHGCLSQNCAVNTKGFYYFKISEEHSAVLRFYDNGVVLASSSTNDYKEVDSWFNSSNTEMILSGKYKKNKCNFSFSVKGITGEQSYKIDLKDNIFKAEVADQKTKTKTIRSYQFYPTAQ